MPTTQLQVIDQNLCSGGSESCGYHTFKNALLVMLHTKGLISDKQFSDLRNNKAFFEAVLAQTVHTHGHGASDVTLPVFLTRLSQAHKGDFDFSRFGIRNTDLAQLNITPDGTQNITAANYVLYPGAPGHGLGGMEEDLLVAASTVKLAKTKGATNHVFALGLNNEHWVTAAMTQDATGQRSWTFMDSWRNQTRYKDTVVHKIEAVLTKTDAELKDYLLEAYTNSNNNFNQLLSLLNPETGEPFVGEEDDALARFNGQPQKVDWVANRFQFMQHTGWLTAQTPEEKAHVVNLYNVAHYILTTANDPDTIQKMQPICEQLRKSRDGELHEEVAQDQPAQVIAAPAKDVSHPIDEDALKKQQEAAINAVTHSEPKPTEGFVARFVNAIRTIWEGIKSAAEYVARSVGIVR
ncbi:hypothetical protein Lade_0859 [Legionella adelaidensis]|uniref:Uncharacterized protein n=1 Tax=Legionella adelaidensis TaxID=45056 RepID=A0A0W0R5A9_9GAMM|nr:hypothetical protein [Legionella adelaidensis]KTC66201.1 hypothetical protein Lade_0859 [Legionella adelaidensis]